MAVRLYDREKDFRGIGNACVFQENDYQYSGFISKSPFEFYGS